METTTVAQETIKTLGDVLTFFGVATLDELWSSEVFESANGAPIVLYLNDGRVLTRQEPAMPGEDYINAVGLEGFTLHASVPGSDARIDSAKFRLPVGAREVTRWIGFMEGEVTRVKLDVEKRREWNRTWAEDVARMKAEKRSRAEMVNKLAREIAARLEGVWQATEIRDADGDLMTYAKIAHADGYSFDISLESRDKERLTVSGNWPRTQDGKLFFPSMMRNEKTPGIGVNIKRGADVIAREITRRFLPGFLEVWHECKRLADADEAYKSTQGRNVERFAALFGLRFHQNSGEAYVPVIGAGYGRLRVQGESVDLHLKGLNPGLAETILQLLKDRGLLER